MSSDRKHISDSLVKMAGAIGTLQAVKSFIDADVKYPLVAVSTDQLRQRSSQLGDAIDALETAKIELREYVWSK